MKQVAHTDGEFCLNLWYHVHDSGYVFHIAAKVYSLVGTDEQKLAALHTLAQTDYRAATAGPVPEVFIAYNANGEAIRGAVDTKMLHIATMKVFGELIDSLEQQLPPLILWNGGEYKTVQQKLPGEPLFVLTGVTESKRGVLTANVK